MDMYQKRKMRKEKSINKKEEVSDNKMNINCDIGINGNHIEIIEK